MASLLDNISGMLDEHSLAQVGTALGTTREQTNKALSAGLPSILGGLADVSADPAGAARIHRTAAAANTRDLDDIAGLFGRSDTSSGTRMLDGVLGSRVSGLASVLGSQTGLGQPAFDRLLPMLAPLVLGVVGRRAAAEQLDGSGISDLLSRERVELERRGYGSLLGLTSDSTSGTTTDPSATSLSAHELADEPEPSDGLIAASGPVRGPAVTRADSAPISSSAPPMIGSTPSPLPDPSGLAGQQRAVSGPGLNGGVPSAPNRNLAWLWPALGLLMAVLVVGFLLTQCGGGDDDGGEDDSSSTTVDTDAGDTGDTDLDLTASVAAAVGAVSGSDAVIGEVDGDVVTLTGQVPDEETAAAAVAAAAGVDGVGEVDDQLVRRGAEIAADDTTIIGTASAAGDYSTLLSAIDAAGLTDTVRGSGPFTVFAPHDAAFAALGDEIPTDPTAIAALLQDHIVAGNLIASDLQDVDSVTALSGRELSVQIVDNDLLVDGAPVSAVDISASNGTIHQLSEVILPLGGLASLPTGDQPAGTDGDTSTGTGGTLNDELDLEPVAFESGSARITGAGTDVLDQVVVALTEQPRNLEIGGHTDSSGDSGTNQSLSEARAEAVLNYLVDEGVDAETLIAVGYGEAEPVSTNETTEGRAENRRIDFTVTG